MYFLGFLITTAIVITLAYQGANIKVWIGVYAIGLLFVTSTSDISGYLLLPVWGLSIGIALLLGVRDIRREYLSATLLNQFKKVIPAMSQTEKEALEAGSVWWDAELFSGKPDWFQLLQVPKARLSHEETLFLDGPTNQLCRLLDDWKITSEDQDLPEKAWELIKKEGFFGLIIPKQYGGKAFSAKAHSEVVMRLSSRSITAAVTVMVPNSLGPGKLLLDYGTTEQRDYYLPRLARGEEIPCFALTGPDAGSDAGSIPDSGVVCYGEWKGENTLGVKLNWDKRYITLGPICTLLGLAFKLYDPDKILSDEVERGITLALIPRDTKGVTIGARHVPLNIPFQNGPNQGKDVFIPLSQLIGDQKYIGQGWRMLVEALSEGRGVSLPSLSVGAGKLACRYTGAYAAIRRQFNMPIGCFEGIEKPLARIAGLTYQMDAARNLTLSALDLGEKPSVISAIVKYHLTEKYRECINDAMDIQGGSGICLGPNNLIGRVYQAIPIAITVEGANILTRSMIIFGQGAVRAHPWILKELTAVHNKDKKQGLIDFDKAIFGHISFIIGNIARSFMLGLTQGYLSQSPVQGSTKRYYQKLHWMSAAFALTADAAMMTLGGSLKRKERLSARLGDVLSELYLSSAVLKRFEDEGRQQSDLPLVEWACENSLYKMQESFRLLFRNLPMRPLAWLLRWIIFPTGLPYTEPKDALDSAVAKLLLSPSDARDRLTKGVYTSDDMACRQGQFEAAFKQAAKVAPLEKTLREAKRANLLKSKDLNEQVSEALEQNLISKTDVEDLKKMKELRSIIVSVDSFDDFGKQFVLNNNKQSLGDIND